MACSQNRFNHEWDGEAKYKDSFWVHLNWAVRQALLNDKNLQMKYTLLVRNITSFFSLLGHNKSMWEFSLLLPKFRINVNGKEKLILMSAPRHHWKSKIRNTVISSDGLVASLSSLWRIIKGNIQYIFTLNKKKKFLIKFFPYIYLNQTFVITTPRLPWIKKSQLCWFTIFALKKNHKTRN